MSRAHQMLSVVTQMNILLNQKVRHRRLNNVCGKKLEPIL